MPKIDDYELEVLSTYKRGKLKSVATKGELAKLKAAARATAVKDRRVNIRLSSGDLIASVLHKYVTGHLAERVESAGARPRGRSAKRGGASAN